jgi:hypothetical protein
MAKRTRYPYQPALGGNTDEARADNEERNEREESERNARGGKDVTTPSPDEEPTEGVEDPDYSDTSPDDPRDDSDDEARADTRTEGEGDEPVRTTEADGPAFIVEDEGTIINGIYYPDSQAKAGMEKVVYMPEAEAQELVKNGMRLTNRETMEPVEAPEEEPETEEPPPTEETDELPEGSMRGDLEDNVRRSERERGAPNPDVDPTIGEQTRLSAVRDPNRGDVQDDMTQPRTAPNPAQPRDKGPNENRPRADLRTR